MTGAGDIPRGGCVLVVDDDPVSLMMLSRILSLFTSAEIHEAADGVEGLELAKEKQPAVIFLDIDMPRKNGLELLEDLRKDPDFARTPILMVSASANPDHVTQAGALGANDFIKKPINPKLIQDRAGPFLPGIASERTG